MMIIIITHMPNDRFKWFGFNDFSSSKTALETVFWYFIFQIDELYLKALLALILAFFHVF